MFVVPLALLLMTSPGLLQAQDAGETPTIAGTVTINGNVAAQGVRLLARDTEGGQDCGLSLVGIAGAYSMPLTQADDDGCTPGSSVSVLLAATPGEAPVAAEVPQGPATVDLSFTGVSDEAMAAIAAEAAITGTPGEGTSTTDPPPRPEGPPSLLGDGELFLLLTTIVTATVLLLVVMVIARLFESRKRLKFLESVADWKEPGTEALVKLIGPEGELPEYRLFPRQLIEGMVLSVVIIAILVLGSTGRVTQEGLVSVLAAIVGYAAGRASSST
jgi:hypothetical protein